jgi:ADP-ribose pyrophosphatase YjhB (NUDIX family)
MKKVSKVMMFVYKEGVPDKFFVVHRKAYEGKPNDYVVPTGHVEEGETIEETASREVDEEMGVKPNKVVKTAYVTEAMLENNTKHSTEYAFLIEIPNVEVIFNERGEDGGWHSLSELEGLLTYKGQKSALPFLESS